MLTKGDKLRQLLAEYPPSFAHSGDGAAAVAAHVAQADPHAQYLQAGDVVQVPLGGIIGWSGTLASCPAGFAVCNGVDNAPGPDLTAQFVV